MNSGDAVESITFFHGISDRFDRDGQLLADSDNIRIRYVVGSNNITDAHIVSFSNAIKRISRFDCIYFS